MVAEHRYVARVRWEGSTAVGYAGYSREHVATVGALDETLTSDPHFGGDPAYRNPEQLFLLAASSCQLLSFLAVAARARVEVTGYTDDASALMTDASGPLWVERIELRPRIVLAAGSRTDRLQRLVELAHRECFIARSVRSGMRIEAQIVVRDRVEQVVHVSDPPQPRVG